MKKHNTFFSKALGFTIILVTLSCAKPLQWVNPQEPENRDDMVTVLFSAAEGGLSKVSGITDASERHIGRWAVFAFDNSSSWFRYATSDSGGDIPMNLLAAHSYSCFAIVNYSTSGTGAFLPATVSTPSDLSEKVAYLGDNAVGNLLMYGSASFIPMTGAQDCTIPVRRIVSRINVPGVAVDFSEKPLLAAKTFTLRHIYITNAYRTTTYGSDYTLSELSDARAAWYNSGGWHRGESGESGMDALLGQRNINAVITAGSPYTVLQSFYAFPNPVSREDDDQQLTQWTRRCTRIVLEATLGDDTVYYQIHVPEMERNYIYTADNIVIRGRGSHDPEIPDEENLDVSVSIQDGWDDSAGGELNL